MTGLSAFLALPGAIVASDDAVKQLFASVERAAIPTTSTSPRAERLFVYRQFQQAVADFLDNQQMLRSAVPALKGGLWSMPVHFRHLRHMSVANRNLLWAVSDVRLIGSPEVFIKVKLVMVPLRELATVKAPLRASDIPEVAALMQPHVEAFGDALTEFVNAARDDLGLNKRRRHFWRIRRGRSEKDAVRPNRTSPELDAPPPAARN
jgi:hypothetical protein